MYKVFLPYAVLFLPIVRGEGVWPCAYSDKDMQLVRYLVEDPEG